jgi:hypothetical protein
MYMITCQLKVDSDKLKVVNIDGREVGFVNELYKLDAVALLLKTLSRSELTSLEELTSFTSLLKASLPTLEEVSK